MDYKHNSFSQVTAVGNVTCDPHYSEDGTPFLSFQIAVDEFYGGGEGQEPNRKTFFFGVVAYGDVARKGRREVWKGAPVFVHGKLRQDDAPRGQGTTGERKTKIHAFQIRALVWPQQEEQRERTQQRPQQNSRQSYSRPSQPPQRQQYQQEPDDDDAPF